MKLLWQKLQNWNAKKKMGYYMQHQKYRNEDEHRKWELKSLGM